MSEAKDEPCNKKSLCGIILSIFMIHVILGY